MKLLIVTQSVDKNDPVLGFFYRWIEEFAKHCEKVTVIALRKGECSFPPNVTVYSLGKEKKEANRLVYALRFLKTVWDVRSEYDTVFVHMNPEYVVLGGVLWRLLGKKIGLWYTHKAVNLKLRVAEKLTHLVFTASQESFRLESSKLHVTGHGIDVSVFKPRTSSTDSKLQLLTVGRISEVKNLKLQLRAVANLPKDFNWKFMIIGDALNDGDSTYLKESIALCHELKIAEKVTFAGSRPHVSTLLSMSEADIFLHTSDTGSLDKVLLEALASGLKVVSTSAVLPDMEGIFRAESTYQSLGGAIERSAQAVIVGEKQREYVNRHHSLVALIPTILNLYHKM